MPGPVKPKDPNRFKNIIASRAKAYMVFGDISNTDTPERIWIGKALEAIESDPNSAAQYLMQFYNDAPIALIEYMEYVRSVVGAPDPAAPKPDWVVELAATIPLNRVAMQTLISILVKHYEKMLSGRGRLFQKETKKLRANMAALQRMRALDAAPTA